MADVAHTPESVALALLTRIAQAENWESGVARHWNKTRKEILDTYAECLETVKAPSTRLHP